jgi:hypothetical protein
MLDSPEDVCAGQAGFEYPATSVLFSMSPYQKRHQHLTPDIRRSGEDLPQIPRTSGRPRAPTGDCHAGVCGSRGCNAPGHATLTPTPTTTADDKLQVVP